MGIAYVAAAFAVIPGLLFVFNRLSRTPDPFGPQEHLPFAEPPRPPSVSDEAEKWLQSQP